MKKLPLGALILAATLSIVMLAPTAATAASKKDGGRSQSCRPPLQRDGLRYWRHGDGRSLRPPPNWDCKRPARKARSCTRPPLQPDGTRYWRHGDGRSQKPPPNCGKGTATDDDTTDEETDGLVIQVSGLTLPLSTT